MAAFESSLDYSHRNVSALPDEVINSNNAVTLLDASNNNITDVEFVGRFRHLNSLILDHNQITSDTVFPKIPTLNTLWLNYNNIDILQPFIYNLKRSFPNLKHLSMMENIATPPCTEDTFYDYVKYRLLVLSCFTDLEYLDDRPITQYEKDEAKRLFGRDRSGQYSSPQFNISDFMNSAVNKLFSFIDVSPVTGRSTPFVERASVI